MRRLLPSLVVIGVALCGVIVARRRFATRTRPSPTLAIPTAADQLVDRTVDDRPLVTAVAEDPPDAALSTQTLDRGSLEAEQVRAAWVDAPATPAEAAVTDPPARSRLRILVPLGVLAAIVALGLAMWSPTSDERASPPPRAVAGSESTPVPTATAAPTPGSTVGGATAQVAAPDGTVRAYYARAAAHEYTAAAALWFSATGEPVGTASIERRFAATQAITVHISEVVFQGPSSASVAARIEEVTARGTDRYEVLWQLVNVNGRWLLENALR